MSIPTAKHTIGDTFSIQFAWRLPDGDYLRAVFEAEVLELADAADKYIVRLNRLVAGRQETKDGHTRPLEEYSQKYWGMVNKLIPHKVQIAYEVQDGRAVHMRLATLTGEHNFFSRYEKVEEVSEKVKKLMRNQKV